MGLSSKSLAILFTLLPLAQAGAQSCPQPDHLENGSTCNELGTLILPGAYSDLNVSSLEQDIYNVWIGPHQTLSVTALFSHSNGDISMSVGFPCTPGNIFGQTQTDNEFLFWPGLSHGHSVQIIVAMQTPGVTCAPYSLVVDVQGAPSPERAAFCFGDGSGADCPCFANSTAGGCTNSTGRGASLLQNGGTFVPDMSLGFDQLALTLRGAPPASFAVLVAGDNALPVTSPGLGIPSFSGLRCVGGNLKRMGTRATDANGEGASAWGFSGAGPAGGLANAGGWSIGDTALFQVFYRDSTTGICGTGINSTNAIRAVVSATAP